MVGCTQSISLLRHKRAEKTYKYGFRLPELAVPLNLITLHKTDEIGIHLFVGI